MRRKYASMIGAVAILASCHAPERITTTKAYDSFKHADASVILYSADWCAPCKAIEPLYREISNSYNCRSGEVDIDEVPSAQEDILTVDNVATVPSIAGYRNGKMVRESSGFATEAHARSTIEKIFEEICKK